MLAISQVRSRQRRTLCGFGLWTLLVCLATSPAVADLWYQHHQKAQEALARHDVVFVHMEAPDEAGHQGDRDLKILAIEKVDGEFLGPLLAGLPAVGDCRILVSPDHPTPLATRTHAAEMVPFIIWPTPDNGRSDAYHEKAARESGLTVEKGHRLLGRLIAKG